MLTDSISERSTGEKLHGQHLRLYKYSAQVCLVETGDIQLIDNCATLTYDLRDPNHITIHVINLVTGNFLAGGKTFGFFKMAAHDPFCEATPLFCHLQCESCRTSCHNPHLTGDLPIPQELNAGKKLQKLQMGPLEFLRPLECT